VLTVEKLKGGVNPGLYCSCVGGSDGMQAFVRGM